MPLTPGTARTAVRRGALSAGAASAVVLTAVVLTAVAVPAVATAAPPDCTTSGTQEIGAVQGTGATSPLAGTAVTVRGVVVGDEPGLSGFYLQDADGDGDAATSDGVFILSPVPVDLGDTVAVTGQAQEYSGNRKSVV